MVCTWNAWLWFLYIHINTHHCWELMKSVGYCGNLISSLPSVLKKMMRSLGTLSHGKFVPAVFHDEEHEVSLYLVMESLWLPFFCDEEDNEISGKLATAEHYSSVMKKATVWHLCGSLGYVPTLLLLQCLFTFELFCCGDRFLCNQSQSRHEEECWVHVSGRFHRFICFQSFSTKDIIIFWKQETVGCLAARISFSPGLDLYCMCLENSKTINPFFFSWIGFALHVSGELQNNQSFLLLLDWICIACVWRTPKQSFLSSSPGLDLHCMCLENSKTIITFFFSWIGFALHVSREVQNNQSFLLLLDWIGIACVWRSPKQSILSSSPGLDFHCMSGEF